MLDPMESLETQLVEAEQRIAELRSERAQLGKSHAKLYLEAKRLREALEGLKELMTVTFAPGDLAPEYVSRSELIQHIQGALTPNEPEPEAPTDD